MAQRNSLSKITSKTLIDNNPSHKSIIERSQFAEFFMTQQQCLIWQNKLPQGYILLKPEGSDLQKIKQDVKEKFYKNNNNLLKLESGQHRKNEKKNQQKQAQRVLLGTRKQRNQQKNQYYMQNQLQANYKPRKQLKQQIVKKKDKPKVTDKNAQPKSSLTQHQQLVQQAFNLFNPGHGYLANANPPNNLDITGMASVKQSTKNKNNKTQKMASQKGRQKEKQRHKDKEKEKEKENQKNKQQILYQPYQYENKNYQAYPYAGYFHPHPHTHPSPSPNPHFQDNYSYNYDYNYHLYANPNLNMAINPDGINIDPSFMNAEPLTNSIPFLPSNLPRHIPLPADYQPQGSLQVNNLRYLYGLAYGNPMSQRITKLEDRQKNFCMNILNKLKNHKSSQPFKVAVDPEGQGVPDYYYYIYNPMDLATIQKKLVKDKYRQIYQFHADINRIILNSYKYNMRETSYFRAAVQFQDFYQELLKQASQNPLQFAKQCTQKNIKKKVVDDFNQNQVFQRVISAPIKQKKKVDEKQKKFNPSFSKNSNSLQGLTRSQVLQKQKNKEKQRKSEIQMQAQPHNIFRNKRPKSSRPKNIFQQLGPLQNSNYPQNQQQQNQQMNMEAQNAYEVPNKNNNKTRQKNKQKQKDQLSFTFKRNPKLQKAQSLRYDKQAADYMAHSYFQGANSHSNNMSLKNNSAIEQRQVDKYKFRKIRKFPQEKQKQKGKQKQRSSQSNVIQFPTNAYHGYYQTNQSNMVGNAFQHQNIFNNSYDNSQNLQTSFKNAEQQEINNKFNKSKHFGYNKVDNNNNTAENIGNKNTGSGKSLTTFQQYKQFQKLKKGIINTGKLKQKPLTMQQMIMGINVNKSGANIRNNQDEAIQDEQKSKQKQKINNQQQITKSNQNKLQRQKSKQKANNKNKPKVDDDYNYDDEHEKYLEYQLYQNQEEENEQQEEEQEQFLQEEYRKLNKITTNPTENKKRAGVQLRNKASANRAKRNTTKTNNKKRANQNIEDNGQGNEDDNKMDIEQMKNRDQNQSKPEGDRLRQKQDAPMQVQDTQKQMDMDVGLQMMEIDSLDMGIRYPNGNFLDIMQDQDDYNMNNRCFREYNLNADENQFVQLLEGLDSASKNNEHQMPQSQQNNYQAPTDARLNIDWNTAQNPSGTKNKKKKNFGKNSANAPIPTSNPQAKIQMVNSNTGQVANTQSINRSIAINTNANNFQQAISLPSAVTLGPKKRISKQKQKAVIQTNKKEQRQLEIKISGKQKQKDKDYVVPGGVSNKNQIKLIYNQKNIATDHINNHNMFKNPNIHPHLHSSSQNPEKSLFYMAVEKQKNITVNNINSYPFLSNSGSMSMAMNPNQSGGTNSQEISAYNANFNFNKQEEIQDIIKVSGNNPRIANASHNNNINYSNSNSNLQLLLQQNTVQAPTTNYNSPINIPNSSKYGKNKASSNKQMDHNIFSQGAGLNNVYSANLLNNTTVNANMVNMNSTVGNNQSKLVQKGSSASQKNIKKQQLTSQPNKKAKNRSKISEDQQYGQDEQFVISSYKQSRKNKNNNTGATKTRKKISKESSYSGESQYKKANAQMPPAGHRRRGRQPKKPLQSQFSVSNVNFHGQDIPNSNINQINDSHANVSGNANAEHSNSQKFEVDVRSNNGGNQMVDAGRKEESGERDSNQRNIARIQSIEQNQIEEQQQLKQQDIRQQGEQQAQHREQQIQHQNQQEQMMDYEDQQHQEQDHSHQEQGWQQGQQQENEEAQQQGGNNLIIQGSQPYGNELSKIIPLAHNNSSMLLSNQNYNINNRNSNQSQPQQIHITSSEIIHQPPVPVQSNYLANPSQNADGANPSMFRFTHSLQIPQNNNNNDNKSDDSVSNSQVN